jgi:hypothetical protein
MTPTRLAQYETLIRKLRQMCFDNDRAADLIPAVKAHCKKDWDKHASIHRAGADQRFMFRTS